MWESRIFKHDKEPHGQSQEFIDKCNELVERLENFKKENFTPCENSPENPQSCCDLQAETEDKENLCS